MELRSRTFLPEKLPLRWSGAREEGLPAASFQLAHRLMLGVRRMTTPTGIATSRGSRLRRLAAVAPDSFMTTV